MDRIKFIVAEKSYLLRKGIASIINRLDRTTVVKELDTLDNINSELLTHQPDFVVLNPNMIPDRANFRNFEIKTDLKEKGIALLSTPPQRTGMHENFLLIIDINEDKESIIKKLNQVLEPVNEKNDSLITSNELSDREKTILKYVAKGLTNKEIAEKLYLSAHTVITHRKNITAKLGIKTISGLTVYAILNNLISLNEIR